MVTVGHALDQVAAAVRTDCVGGFSAPVRRGRARGDEAPIDAIPEVLSLTERVFAVSRLR
ncbi:MAG TPA: DUF711 family protein [Acidobacteriota bacterium]|nr:DUF711 family protein [Acidobacteriota bacterium]